MMIALKGDVDGSGLPQDALDVFASSAPIATRYI